MSEKTNQTAVVLIPPLELWEPIQEIRRRHDRQFRRWMPHITLLYPFRPAAQFNIVAPALVDCCRTVERFSLTLGEFRVFDHGASSHTIWLAPQPTDPICRLQNRLLACCPDCDDANRHASGFTPHLSMGQAHSREEAERLVGQLRTFFNPVTFEVRDVAMIRREAARDARFEVDRLIPLGP